MSLHRNISATISTALVAALPIVFAGTATAAETPSEPLSRPSAIQANISDCLAPGSTVKPDEIVWSVEVKQGNHVVRRHDLFCSTPEASSGARHINADHPVGNVVAFQDCLWDVLTRGTPFDGNELSVVWKLPYGAGGEANVYTDKASGEILTAFTSGPVSNDWEGCASAVRRDRR